MFTDEIGVPGNDPELQAFGPGMAEIIGLATLVLRLQRAKIFGKYYPPKHRRGNSLPVIKPINHDMIRFLV
jgi:hypothetical protein